MVRHTGLRQRVGNDIFIIINCPMMWTYFSQLKKLDPRWHPTSARRGSKVDIHNYNVRQSSSKGTRTRENPVGTTTQSERGLCFYQIRLTLWKLTARLGQVEAERPGYNTVGLHMPKICRKNTHLLSNTYFQKAQWAFSSFTCTWTEKPQSTLSFLDHECDQS